DRNVRKSAWELVAARRLQEREKFDAQFDELVGLRHQIALNAGFKNYRDYAFRRLGRFDYTPADCEQFHDAVATELMPLLRELQVRRRKHMGLDQLRPWDLAADPLGRAPLLPFESVDGLLGGTQRIFQKLDGGLESQFNLMRSLRLLDLANRKGKAPGGYQST